MCLLLVLLGSISPTVSSTGCFFSEKEHAWSAPVSLPRKQRAPRLSSFLEQCTPYSFAVSFHDHLFHPIFFPLVLLMSRVIERLGGHLAPSRGQLVTLPNHVILWFYFFYCFSQLPVAVKKNVKTARTTCLIIFSQMHFQLLSNMFLYAINYYESIALQRRLNAVNISTEGNNTL